MTAIKVSSGDGVGALMDVTENEEITELQHVKCCLRHQSPLASET